MGDIIGVLSALTPRPLTTVNRKESTMAAEDTTTKSTYNKSYYDRVRNDPEFKRKRKEYNARYNREKMEKMNGLRRAWAIANPERTRQIAKDCRSRKQIQYIFSNIKKRAKKTGKEFSIELEDIVIPAVCPIFGIPLVYGATIDDCDFAPSVDRIDSAKGYIKGNVQVISRLANCMKWTATPEQLIAFASGILNLYQHKS